MKEQFSTISGIIIEELKKEFRLFYFNIPRVKFLLHFFLFFNEPQFERVNIFFFLLLFFHHIISHTVERKGRKQAELRKFSRCSLIKEPKSLERKEAAFPRLSFLFKYLCLVFFILFPRVFYEFQLKRLIN